MFCGNCGKEIPDDSLFCPECGNKIERINSINNSNIKVEENVSMGDADVNMAIAAYITWIGFLIAMFADSKNSKFNRFHLNQALIINIAATVGVIIPIVGIIIALAAVVYAILGIISASEKSVKPLPLLDKIKLM